MYPIYSNQQFLIAASYDVTTSDGVAGSSVSHDKNLRLLRAEQYCCDFFHKHVYKFVRSHAALRTHVGSNQQAGLNYPSTSAI